MGCKQTRWADCFSRFAGLDGLANEAVLGKLGGWSSKRFDPIRWERWTANETVTVVIHKRSLSEADGEQPVNETVETSSVETCPTNPSIGLQ